MLEGKGTFCWCGKQLLRSHFLHGTRTRILVWFVRVREWGPAPTISGANLALAFQEADLCASRQRREESNPTARVTRTEVLCRVLCITESDHRAKTAPRLWTSIYTGAPTWATNRFLPGAPHSDGCQSLLHIDRYRGIVEEAVFDPLGQRLFFDAAVGMVMSVRL